MLRYLAILVVVSSLALAQAPGAAPATKPAAKPAPGAQKTSKAPAAKADKGGSSLPGNTPVVTIQGVCPTPKAPAKGAKAAAPAPCKTVITRAQFDNLVEAVAPTLPPQMRRQLATQYAQMMVVAQKARNEGMQKSPAVEQMVAFNTTSSLARYYVQHLQKKMEDVPLAQLQKYYDDNKAKYQSAKVLRLYIPKPFGNEVKPEDQKTAADLAQKIHDRAAAGEDFTKLEQEGYDDIKKLSNIPDAEKQNYAPPAVDLGDLRPGRLPEAHESKVFALKAGDVTAVIPEASGFFIYKLVSKQDLSFDQVKDEIKQQLGQKAFQEAMKQLLGSVNPELNEAYFGPPAGQAGAEEGPSKSEAPKGEETPKK